MTNEQKKQVKDALLRYTANFATQSLAADSLQGISSSTISQVKNNNWELLSDHMWHTIARQVGFYCGEWQPADTAAYLLLRILFSDAQHYAMTYGIAIGTGLGKTFSATQYARENDNTCYFACNEDYNRKSFMTALMKTAGLDAKGTVPQMLQSFTNYITDKDEPLVILDDAHKLKDRVLHLAVLLANGLAANAGIIILGADELRSRVLEGVRLKKIGYDDIYKSIGRRFITLNSPGIKDVELICRANGVYDEDIINHLKEECNNNQHNVVYMLQQMQVNKAA